MPNRVVLLTSCVVVLGCSREHERTSIPAPSSGASAPSDGGARTWSGDDPGWIAGFADYPRGVEKDWNFTSEVRALPAPLTASHRALFIAGDNHSDDLFMFWKRSVGGLEPRTTYEASFDVSFASNAPAHCTGVGGAPGESVYVKVGASTAEPVLLPGDDVRISIDKGNQGTDGREAIVIGDVATSNTDCKNKRWELKQLHSKGRLQVKSDDKGTLWILVGTDSGFEARTEIYYSSIALTLEKATGAATAALSTAAAESFTPAALPDPHIAGFHFPESEPTVEGWSKANDEAAMARHAWGIWTALNASSGQQFHGESLRVFETWSTPGDLLSSKTALSRGLVDPRPLGELRQFRHTKTNALTEHGDQTVLGFVKFDPSAAEFITTNELFSAAKLATFKGTGAIPDFPASAIALKPVYEPLPASSAVKGRYFRVAHWPGPPSSPVAFPQNQWKQCIWIDVEDPSDGPGTSVDTKCAKDGSSRTSASTYGLGRFIHFQMSASDADARNALLDTLDKTMTANVARSKAGDYAVLLAMHVTTREITRWTWATFWWTATPDQPAAPSSSQIAAQRPSELKGAPRNYAHCVSNMMEFPPEPNAGGKNQGESVYCYNPWLEAGFGPSVLPDSLPGTYKGKTVANNVGIQTNCMSCHAQAYFDPANGPAPQSHYAGDRYVDLAAPLFKGKVRVDFLWSVSDLAH